MKNKKLVIVESPTKARTIGKMLGKEFTVVPSMGHLIDLPKRKIGVDIEKDFEPEYVVISKRKKILSQLKKEGKASKDIYVATDPDREGEAIGWHIKERLFNDRQVLRVVFHEITSNAVKTAFQKARDFNMKMVEAQIGRRTLDRIVGYFLSPLLWKKVAYGLSAGRVQSVALRFIVEREKEIEAFKPQEYWEITAELKKIRAQGTAEEITFLAKFDKADGKKIQIKSKPVADSLVEDISKQQFQVGDIKQKEKKRSADAPFITSTLQQEAFNKLRFNANKTMIVAQQLYEGIDIDGEGPVGLITYMRTDSTRIAPEAVQAARELILNKFGAPYLPEKPNVYKVKKFAQEAHEAIRPTFISKSPEELMKFLDEDQYRLYELIYNRFIASQMSPARYSVVSVSVNAGRYTFAASGTTMVFDGFTRVYKKNQEEEKEKKNLPPLEKDEILELNKLVPSQHFTKPPPRFSDSSLIKILEEEGIGRPSTYAPIIHTLILRNYVRRIKGYLHPTELGVKVCDLLIEFFPGILDVKFTAHLEEELDGIEEGRSNRIDVLRHFYEPFKNNFDYAQNNIKKEVIQTEDVCERCGKPMIIKWGRKGKFLSCSGFPECRNSKSITSGVKCPAEGCAGELIERRSRRGFFYGCSKYPQCTYTSKTLPGEKDE